MLPFTVHDVILSTHSFGYVSPSLPHTGSKMREHRCTHVHCASLFSSIEHSEWKGHCFVEHGSSVCRRKNSKVIKQIAQLGSKNKNENINRSKNRKD